MKNIKELTIKEATQILEFVFHNKEYSVTSLSFEPIFDKDGKQNITFSCDSIIGILYHNGQDRCLLHFYNTKVILWLYNNGYDIKDLLESSAHLSQLSNDFDSFALAIHSLVDKQNHVKEDKKHLYTLEYVLENLTKYLNKYYFKDYI